VVLTDPKRGTVKLIDLESSVECGVDAFNRFSTPGFASQRHFQEGARDWADDAYSLGAIFLHNLLPGNLMFQLEPAAAGRFLDRAAAYFGLPKQVHGAGAIAGLLSPDPAERPTVEEVVRVLEDGVVPLEPQDLDTLPPEDVLESVVDRAVEYILSSADSSRDTRLFPGDIASRQSNPLSVAYGVAGVVHALKTIGKPVPGWVLAWVLDKGYRHLNAERMTPGLYLGLCGVSWVLREQGLEDLADRLLRLASRHPLLFEESSLFYGTSGYGLACLAAYERTRQQRWLDEADRAGREIRQRAVENRETLWTSQQLQKYTGYARGGSGVALFLLYLAHATQDAAYLELGKEALEWDLRHVMPYPEMPDVDSLKRDPNDPDDNVVSHYWVDGSAGVVTALLRYWRYTGETRYKGVLDRLIPDCCRWYTAFPNLFQGLAGLGNTLLDVYEFTGDPRFLQEAHRTADGILLFRVERLSGLAFPGQQLLRISTDFGTGSAGIIAFLDRLRRALRGERTENFNFMLDSLVPEFIRAAEPVQTAGSA